MLERATLSGVGRESEMRWRLKKFGKKNKTAETGFDGAASG